MIAASDVVLGQGGTAILRRVRLRATGLYPALTLSLALFTYGVATMLGGSGYLAAYVAALVDPAEEDSLVQRWADELNVAFVGVSGTKAKAATRFVWAEDAKADMARVTAALAEVKDKVTIKPGSLIAFGFSQGAQTGASSPHFR